MQPLMTTRKEVRYRQIVEFCEAHNLDHESISLREASLVTGKSLVTIYARIRSGDLEKAEAYTAAQLTEARL